MKKLFLCFIIFLMFFSGCSNQSDITPDSNDTQSSETTITDPNDVQPTDEMTPQQAFVEKGYFSLLNEYALQYVITDFYIKEHQLTLRGDIEAHYYWSDQLYNLYIISDMTYEKDGQTKDAHLVVATACYNDMEIIYDATLTISDGQTFYLGYSPMYNSILNNDEFSEEKGNAMSFVTPLHLWILSIFKEAETITTLQYPLLTAWYQQQTAVQENIKTWNQVISAYDIIDSADETLNLSFGTPDKRIITFFNKGYWNLLEKTSYSARLTGITMDLASLHTTGDIGIHYYFDDDMFNLIIEKEINYTKNDKPKSGSLYITYICKGDYNAYGGIFTLPDKQTYYILYDPINNILLDNEKGSATFGQPTKFVSSLNAALIEEFKKAYMIATAQYPVLITWNNELNEVKQGLKDFNEIREADTIELTFDELELMFTHSINDFVMTNPCATAMEITKSFLFSCRTAISFSDITNNVTDKDIFYDVLLTIGYDGNEHYPYTYLVRRNEEYIYIWTLKDMKKYAYEVYGHDFEPYIPEEWSSMYKPELNRYESGLEFGLVGEGPETFRIENMYAEQHENQVFVYFDLVWYEVDDNWKPAEITKIQHSVSEYQLMTENGHTFLRHIYTDFGE